MLFAVDVRHALPSVQAPTLVVHKEANRPVPKEFVTFVAESIPNADYRELPPGDHLWWAEGADALLEEIGEFLTGTKPHVVSDRVLATVLFSDIVGSTSLVTAIGDREWLRLLDRHDGVVLRHIERFSGRAVKTTGDGVLAIFDGPARAIRCGSAIVEAARGLGLEARVGIHTGEIEQRGADIAGIAVHIAQRVSAEAKPSEVWVSRTVGDLIAGSNIVLDDRGERRLKGLEQPWRLYAVLP
jgi:class 3 adenylate cyclase